MFGDAIVELRKSNDNCLFNTISRDDIKEFKSTLSYGKLLDLRFFAKVMSGKIPCTNIFIVDMPEEGEIKVNYRCDKHLARKIFFNRIQSDIHNNLTSATSLYAIIFILIEEGVPYDILLAEFTSLMNYDDRKIFIDFNFDELTNYVFDNVDEDLQGGYLHFIKSIYDNKVRMDIDALYSKDATLLCITDASLVLDNIDDNIVLKQSLNGIVHVTMYLDLECNVKSPLVYEDNYVIIPDNSKYYEVHITYNTKNNDTIINAHYIDRKYDIDQQIVYTKIECDVIKTKESLSGYIILMSNAKVTKIFDEIFDQFGVKYKENILKTEDIVHEMNLNMFKDTLDK